MYVWKAEVNSVATAHARGLLKARKVAMMAGFVLSVISILGFAGLLTLAEQQSGAGVAFFTTPHSLVALLPLGLLLFCFAFFERQMILRVIAKMPAGEIEYEEGVNAQMSGDFSEMFDAEAVKAVEDAFAVAEKNGDASVGSIHLFVGAIGTPAGQILFARLGLSIESMKAQLRRHLGIETKGETTFDDRAMGILARAFMLAQRGGRPHVSSLDILAACYSADEFFPQLFEEFSIPSAELNNALHWMFITEELQERYHSLRRAAAFKPTGNMDRAMTAIATPFLDSVSEDLTRDAVYGRTGLLVGRDEELASVFRAIEGGNTSVVLVGPSGVGKSAIIDGIADLMVEEKVPKILEDKRLLKISIPHIVSAQGGKGAEERLLYALREVGHSGNIVLVIEDIHELVGTGSGTGIDLSSILSSELEKGYTFVIATTTAQGYTEAVERSVLGKRLERIVIAEPDRDLAIRIIEAKIGGIEGKHHVVFTYGALASAVDLSIRYLHDGVLPEKAIALLREVALTVSKKGAGLQWVMKEDVAEMIHAKTNIAVTEVTQDEGAKLLNLEAKLHERLIGQETAVSAVSSALRRARTEMRSEGKPIANFLFLGPTGVGKTELAKATAEVFFGNEQSMTRFDMSEYQNKESVSRLIGGNGQGGQLTEAIRRNPFCLLLLDELEKAHPDILNLFLQVMDDGRLTDGLGQTVDFTNVILIATSNAGTQYIQDEVAKGTGLPIIREALMAGELKSLFRPEFLNRFNDVIVFSPLTEADVTAIAYLMIDKVKKRMEAKGISLEVGDAAIHELGRLGYDPKFGARPLRRTIEEKLENKLADELLRGSFERRDTIIFDVGGKIEVRKAEKL
jgi:ATP-dependent Clp protease ATP-binding subunit ClpC